MTKLTRREIKRSNRIAPHVHEAEESHMSMENDPMKLFFSSSMILIVNFHIYRQGYQMFGVKLSFVATRSGLIRWTDHIAHDPNSADP